MKNNNLRTAQKAKNDEFYTMLTDIEKEMRFYQPQFKNKVVYCNCDDARESNFFKYFSLNFEFLGLKKLITTAYKADGHGVILTYEGDKNGNRIVDDNEIHVTELKGNGDFRSAECIELLKEADIVVTNPPFSLFKEYISTLMQYNKKFLIVGNQNAITYKETFSYIKNGQLWLGYKKMGGKYTFIVPNTYNSKSCWVENNIKYASVNSAIWFTNMETNKQMDAPIIINTYNENDYPTYDNYNAINVDKVKELPYDYDGVIGVPITIADKVCSDGFIHFDCPNLPQRDLKYQILGLMADKRDKDEIFIKGKETYLDEKHKKFVGSILKGKATYARILIQKVK